MRLIRDGAEVGINVGDQVFKKNFLEAAAHSSAKAATAAATTSTADIQSVFHHDDEGLGFAVRKQVVHDQIGVTLRAPARFIFTHAVLEIEHRKALARIL